MKSLTTNEWYLKNKKLLMTLPHDVIEAEEEKVAKSPNFNFIIFRILVCAFFLSTGAWLLISATAETLGGGLDAWLKAGLIEIGLIALAVLNPRDAIEKWFVKTTLLALILASFFVLKSGVAKEEASATKSAILNNTELANLQAKRDSYQANHDALPANYISKRNQVLTQLNAVDNEIKELKRSVLSSKSVNSIESLALSEKIIRGLILALNLIFGHALAKCVAEYYFYKEN